MSTIDDLNLISFYTDVTVTPYRDSFAGGESVVVAVVVPGGFTGFGKDADAATSMAAARAKCSLSRAAKAGLSTEDWKAGISRRMTPALLALIRSYEKRKTRSATGDFHGLRLSLLASRHVAALDPFRDLNPCG